MAVVQHRYRERRRQEAERRLLESEDNYRQLVESARDAILVIGRGVILYANSRACQLFDLDHIPAAGSFERLGLPRPETLGPVEEDIRVTVVPDHQLPQSATTEGPPRRLEITYGAISYLGQDAWQLIVRNTTIIERLRQQNRRMQRLATIGELAADFAEEIRPTLETLSSSWKALAPSPISTEDRADVELAIERIQRIVGNVQNFSHMEHAQRTDHDLGALLEEAIRPLRERFALAGVTFEEHFAHRDARVLADRHQILQVFTNLLENARLAMPEGGTIRVSTRNEAGAIEIRIEDSGEGIPKDNLERIFDPFYTTRRDGTGLGLAVVSQILGQHECWHAVESEPEEGTSFILTFPLLRMRAVG
jgi:signal transduction histidine kinase